MTVEEIMKSFYEEEKKIIFINGYEQRRKQYIENKKKHRKLIWKYHKKIWFKKFLQIKIKNILLSLLVIMGYLLLFALAAFFIVAAIIGVSVIFS